MISRKRDLKEELYVSLFSTTIIVIVGGLFFLESIDLYFVLILNFISAFCFVIDIVSNKIFQKYQSYKFKKKHEIIDNNFKDELTRENLKMYGDFPKIPEYYISFFPIKILFSIIMLISLPFTLWHEGTQLLRSFYKRVFRVKPYRHTHQDL